jgi:hypothetical protein
VTLRWSGHNHWDGKLMPVLNERIARSVKWFAIRHGLIPDSLVEWRLRQELERWQARGKTLPTPSLVKQRIVKEYAAQFRLATLVETGTYYGAMIAACQKDFSRIYSIELQECFFRRAQKKFSRLPHISVLQGDSAVELERVLAEIRTPALFWLDAHYSGDVTARGSVETPVVKELELIFAHPIPGHIILIDDARCFDGTHDYPRLSDLADHAPAQGWLLEVQDDVIRLQRREVN